jgi:uncharacterized protein CbrC (UPF0167 family)
VDEISRRTPGFSGWQQEHWLYHCGDGAAFVGLAGYDEVSAMPDAIRTLCAEADEMGWDAAQTEKYVRSLRCDTPPTAYVFRCLHCGTHLAYSDFT